MTLNIDEERWWETAGQEFETTPFETIPYYIVAYTDRNSRLFALGTFTAEQVWNMVKANLKNALSLPHFTNEMLEPVMIAPIEFPPVHQEWFKNYHMNWNLPLYHEQAMTAPIEFPLAHRKWVEKYHKIERAF